MLRVSLLSVLVALVVCGGSLAQRPSGVATPINRVSPQFRSQPLWFGNDFYGYEISRAPAGSAGLLALSRQCASVSVAGIQLSVSLVPCDLISLTPFTTDGAGEASISRPLPGATDPTVAGPLLHAQVAIQDSTSGVLGATPPLHLEVILRPLMFVTSGTLSPQFLDPYSGIRTSINPNYPGNPLESRFINGGRDLILVTTAGIFHCDSLAPSAGFSPWATGL